MNKTELDNIKRILVDDDPIVYNPFDYLYKDDYTSFMIDHLQNQFNKSCVEKVRSHILMTQMIYLMERKAVFVDIQNSKIFYNSKFIECLTSYNSIKNLCIEEKITEKLKKYSICFENDIWIVKNVNL